MHFVADNDYDVDTFQCTVISARITSWLEGQQFFLVWMALKRKRLIQKEGRLTLEKMFLNVELLGEDLSQQFPGKVSSYLDTDVSSRSRI